MPVDFQGLKVISFESRRAAEMAALIARHGGVAISAPSMREIANPSNEEAIAFADRLLAGTIDIVLLLTGVGTKMLTEAVAAKHTKEPFIEALKRVPIVCRGPKPVAVLREMGLKATIEVPEPNTWQDVLAALDKQLPVKGKRIAVQEYGISNARLIAGLKERGAEVVQVPVYKWALPEDLGPLRAAMKMIIDVDASVAMFTSATQAHHLFQLAEQDGCADALRAGFKRVLIASIGPVATEGLVELGLKPDYEPDSPHMANLVRETARRGVDLLEKKQVAAMFGVDTNRWRRIDMVWSPPLPLRERSAESARPGEGGASNPPGGSGSAKRFGVTPSSEHVASHPHPNPLPQRERESESVFLKACRREPTPYTPVWLMRQAGRYQRAYRDIRAGTTMLGLCKSPELSAEVTLMAVDRLGVDAAIIFSDILTVAEPLGFSLDFIKGDGPVIFNPFRERADIARLRPGDPAELSYVYDALRITRRALRPDIALIGFCGAPFTIASYLIEGGKSKDYAKTKTMMVRDPISWTTLMDRLVDLLIAYLNAQVEAGADAVQIFDSWAGSLCPDDYRAHVFPHVKRLIDGVKNVHPMTPLINFATGNPALLPLMRDAGGEVIGLDWRVDLADAWKTIGYDRAIMGNIDPTVLFCSPAEIRRQAKAILDKAAGRPGHIFNLGHGITPEMPPENVAELVDAVHELSRR